MSTWKRKAIETLPELKQNLEEAESPMQAWIELHLAFEQLVLNDDNKKVRAILNFAKWCISEESGKLPNDTSTAAWCAFYEDIGRNKKLWPKFKGWFSKPEFELLKSAFCYGLNEKELKELHSIYYEIK